MLGIAVSQSCAFKRKDAPNVVRNDTFSFIVMPVLGSFQNGNSCEIDSMNLESIHPFIGTENNAIGSFHSTLTHTPPSFTNLHLAIIIATFHCLSIGTQTCNAYYKDFHNTNSIAKSV